MLQQQRVEKLREKMAKKGLKQLLVCDPLAIFYFTEKFIDSGERFLGLLFQANGHISLFANRLFRFDEELNVNKIFFEDGEDIAKLLKDYVLEDQILAVDKILPAKFFLRFIEEKLALSYQNASLLVDALRACKSLDEQEKMRHASWVNDQAMSLFKGLIHEGISEQEVASKMLAIYRQLGASSFSFEPIVAFGKNAADPHHEPDGTILQEGDTILLDVGCVVDHYCSDMTRVFYYKREPDKHTQEIYRLVRRANEEAIKMLKPGIRLADVDEKARSIIREGGYGKDFTHRLGHFIGLETHEEGDVSGKNFSLTEPGNIFSIEPGIYHLESGIGVRIEDLVLITEDGVEVLNHYTHDWEIID